MFACKCVTVAVANGGDKAFFLVTSTLCYAGLPEATFTWGWSGLFECKAHGKFSSNFNETFLLYISFKKLIYHFQTDVISSKKSQQSATIIYLTLVVQFICNSVGEQDLSYKQTECKVMSQV